MRATTRCPQKSSRAVPPAFTLLASQIIVPPRIRRRRYLLQVQRQAVLLEFDSVDINAGSAIIDGEVIVPSEWPLGFFGSAEVIAGGQIGELGFQLRRSPPVGYPDHSYLLYSVHSGSAFSRPFPTFSGSLFVLADRRLYSSGLRGEHVPYPSAAPVLFHQV
jgi:hypothetical protein